MSALAADVSFDFTFPSPSPSLDDPPTPPMESLPIMEYSLDHFPSSLLELPYNSHNHHVRSTSRASSVYSTISAVDSIAESACSRFTTPPRASPPVRQHGPLLLPKIRSQDQQLDQSHVARAAHSRSNSIRSVASARARMVHQRSTPPPASSKPIRTSHSRSYTNPETLANMAFAHISPFNTPPPQTHDEAPVFPSSLLASPPTFAQDLPQPRRTSTIDTATIDKYGYPTYRQMPFVPSTTAASSQSDYMFSSYLPRAPSPLALAATATDSEPSTTLMEHLTCVNPAASLVRTISFPLRDPSIKHFWWDVRSISSWPTFNASTILSLPGASALLNSPVPSSLLQTPSFSSRHPETETALHSIYASYYLPKLNSALAMSSNRPLQLSVPAKTSSGVNDLIFVANPIGESSTAAAMFGGKPTGRVVGLVRSFDRFNTGMRAEGNIKRVDYLRGLAALHYAMREHGCRYGFILTEIELVLIRAGTESTPFFGDLEITSIQLNAAVSEAELDSSDNVPLTACLALWGLCQLAGDQTPAGHAHWKAEIGAPADGTRRKAKARDNWIPKPQLAEKREAKRSRGWVWPEDPIGRKEMGKRGVKYGGLC